MNWYRPYGLDTPAKIYSLWFQRYMHRYGVTNEDFGRYSVVARKHAATNPNAWYFERPITLADHQSSRWIVEPILRLLDCCQESDGGVALVVTRTDRARELAQPLVRIEAATQGNLFDGDTMFNYYGADTARFEEAEYTARQLWETTGLEPLDIDVAMIYENFSPVVFYQLEAYGFCGPGEAKDFIAEGNIEIGGALPVNTNGGLLGEGYIHGVNNIIEGVRQLRGTSANQVSDAQHVLCSAGRSALVLAGAD
jgi:acetyl-CoA acetyltransferase